MASPQVSRKQGHLEAGKKKLEEFRRKKAAEKAKKVASTQQLQVFDGVKLEKQPSEQELVADSGGVGISYDLAEDRLEPSVIFANNRIQETETDYKSDFSSSNDTTAKLSLLAKNIDDNLSVPKHSYLIGDEYKDDTYSVGLDKHETANYEFPNEMNGDVSSAQVALAIGNDNFLAHRLSSKQESDRASIHSNDNGIHNYASIYNNTPEKDFSLGDSGTSVFTPIFLPKNSIGACLQDKLDNGGYLGNSQMSSTYQDSVRSSTNMSNSVFGVGQKFSEFPEMGEKKVSGSPAQMGGLDQSSPWTSNNRYADYSDAQLWSNHAPQSPTASGRRSRPSFLDSIQISKGPTSSFPLSGATKFDSYSSKVYPMDSSAELVSQKNVSSAIDQFNHMTESKHDLFSRKQNEDFAALEQHIEDLTQEKFSLQRALGTSRALAESLASENSTLTDSFNQQGSLVNQLKFDLEKLHEEIKAQLVELEAVKIEYANAQLECNAADERAKLLASEVIGLEEKALRLRSNELKLERLLENSEAEVSSYRKKMSNLEKDRLDLQSTVDALQEEKKLLHVKLRETSAGGRPVDIKKTSNNKKEMSTSTEDLDIGSATEASNSDYYGTELLRNDDLSSQFPHENIMLGLEGPPLTISSDQTRMIQNINKLIAELALEKDQLTQALSAESSQRSKLLELNKELTRKLEFQTQRLELLMSQSMANENVRPRQRDLHAVHESTTYADEGDEVVERVLGWILKLFPGGPSKQRTSKHL